MRNTTTPILVLIAVLLAGPARAATVTTAADDSSLGSLRDAIANAPPGETINFAIGGTITLTNGVLSIDKDLIISGPGASSLVIQRSTASGTPNFRIFDVLAGNVIISGLTVSNGRDDIGGGIYNQANLTLNDCAITGNFATESGGGIFNTSSMTINNCAIRGNSAAGETGDGFGGGIYNAGTASAIACTISNNSVTSRTGDGLGGGICNDGTLTLTSSVFNGNSANGGSNKGGGSGGGINNGGGTVYLTNCTMTGNVARGGAGSEGGLGEGGGVANDFGTVTLDRSTVSGNSAVGGDGGSGGSGEGGGVANDSGTVYVYSSTVSGNVSRGGVGTAGFGSPRGGGIFNDFGSLIVTHSTITANVVPGGLLEDGGGIFNLMGGVELKNTIVAANTATVDLFNVESGDFLTDGIILSDGFNLVGSTNGFSFTGPGDQFNITAAALKLGSLQNNGGPTFTHALLCGSPAINAGDNKGAPATDQRGYARIVGGVIDIGAYEGNNTAPTISCPAPATLNYIPPAGTVATVSVNVADADGDPLVVVWTVDGTAYQTNFVAAGGPPTAASVTFTASFGGGSHSILVRVIDSTQCEATCATTVFVSQVQQPPLPPALGCISVLQLGAASVSVTGPAGGILGNVAIAPNGNLAMTGDQYVSGTILLGSGAKFSNSSHGTVQTAQNVDLSAEISNAYAMAASDASLPCTQSFAKLDGKSVTIILGGPGVNVICVGDISLSGKQLTLLAPAGASFIINVSGKFVLTGGGQGPQIRVAGGVQPEDVLYNIIGAGSDVSFSGGGGGVNCCAAVVDGTVLAPLRKIKLSPGLVNGAVISAKEITIVSGSSVRCPASP